MISRRSLLILVSSGAALASFVAFGACSSGLTSGGAGGSGGSNLSGSGGAGGGTTSSQAATTASSSGTPVPSNVGNACTTDADCGTDLVCVLPSADDPVFRGGPPGGYCSASCALDVDCPSDSICFVRNADAGVGNCTLTCKVGPKLVAFDDPLSPSKCRGRDDVACTPLTSGPDLCLPTCSADSQCGPGLVCDPNRSTCAATATSGLPTGAVCDTPAMAAECAGTCVSFTGGSAATLCSQLCVLGGDPAHPTASTNCGGPSVGLCIFRPANNGAGDYGFCTPACSKQDDCQVPNFWCTPVSGLTGDGGVPTGICTFVTACPNGDSDCTSVAGSTCTDTLYGAVCLAGGFPLGAAAPVDGGLDDGGDAGEVGDAGVDDASLGDDGGAGDASAGEDAGGGDAGAGGGDGGDGG